jgi:hypothetical protein
VVRLCAKSREAVSSPVEHLTLHYQVLSISGTLLFCFSFVHFSYLCFPGIYSHY